MREIDIAVSISIRWAEKKTRSSMYLPNVVPYSSRKRFERRDSEMKAFFAISEIESFIDR